MQCPMRKGGGGGGVLKGETIRGGKTRVVKTEPERGLLYPDKKSM